MARISILSRTNNGPGEIVTPAIPVSKRELQIEVDSLGTDWSDTTILASLILEVSEDGGLTWKVVATATMTGGLGGKGSGLPGIIYRRNEFISAITHCRVRFSLNKRVRAGLIADVTL